LKHTRPEYYLHTTQKQRAAEQSATNEKPQPATKASSPTEKPSPNEQASPEKPPTDSPPSKKTE
ncbi:MAG TPA: hypothetical protein VD713_00910, partial [Sphingomonadales bacterium]|nr:hypothetical protein [Sphingomonadales bacterium]